MREKSYSYSPSPPRGYGRRGWSPSPRGRHGGCGRDLPTSLLVRNLRRDCRPEDLRRPFGQFGPLKDIYLPRDYYTGQPRGFGFVQYVDPNDAAEAKYQMNGQILLGREVTIVFAEENRKKPAEMRAIERERGQSYDYRGSPRHSRSPRYSHPRSLRYSHCSRDARSQSHSRRYYSPSPRRHCSRSISPQDRRLHRERSYLHSPVYSRDRRLPHDRAYSRSPTYSRSRSRSPLDSPSKPSQRERSLSISQ